VLVFKIGSDIVNTMNRSTKHIYKPTYKESIPFRGNGKGSSKASSLFSSIFDIYKKRSKDSFLAYEETKDHLFYKSQFEDHRNLQRRLRLKPSVFHKIVRYLYSFEEPPPYIDMWAAPIRILKESRLHSRILHSRSPM